MDNPHREVVEFVLEQAANQPIAKRSRLYRGLALFAGDDLLAPQLKQMAADLEAADHRCREFAFRFANTKP